MNSFLIASTSRRKTVLLVGRDQAYWESLANAPELSGYLIEFAHDAVHGLRKIEDIQPDLVICDHASSSRPSCGELLLARIQGAYPQYWNIPFLFLATGQAEQTKQGGGAGRSRMLQIPKPSDFQKFKKILENFLD